ncbi:unnamed protein product, partial [Symbiodinium sp. KB8]
SFRKHLAMCGVNSSRRVRKALLSLGVVALLLLACSSTFTPGVITQDGSDETPTTTSTTAPELSEVDIGVKITSKQKVNKEEKKKFAERACEISCGLCLLCFFVALQATAAAGTASVASPLWMIVGGAWLGTKMLLALHLGPAGWVASAAGIASIFGAKASGAAAAKASAVAGAAASAQLAALGTIVSGVAALCLHFHIM